MKNPATAQRIIVIGPIMDLNQLLLQTKKREKLINI
jgi:hypothetical protein